MGFTADDRLIYILATYSPRPKRSVRWVNMLVFSVLLIALPQKEGLEIFSGRNDKQNSSPCSKMCLLSADTRTIHARKGWSLMNDVVNHCSHGTSAVQIKVIWATGISVFLHLILIEYNAML